MHSINDADLTGLDVRGLYRNLGDRSKVQVKLLMFTEDVRPGYIGLSSFSSHSSFVRVETNGFWWI